VASWQSNNHRFPLFTMSHDPPGLFVTGTDTAVGKTYVAGLIAAGLRAAGHRPGVYKPVASGCRRAEGNLVSDDAVALWEAAGRPGTLEEVCPQRFEAPLAPHLAARAEGRLLDRRQLVDGVDFWRRSSDVIVVEGVGGLMSPLGDDLYVADLALAFGFPLVIVAPNVLGTINQTLQTLVAAAAFGEGLTVAGVVLNHPSYRPGDASLASNAGQLSLHAKRPLLAEVAWQAGRFDRDVDWLRIASSADR
jgi:dethiobiotin synthetase